MQYENGSFFDLAYSRMYSPRMTIGDRLDQAMKDAKIPSQSELARRSGVPQATISRILKGSGKKGPETETLKKLAVACGVSFEWLVEGGGEAGTTTPIELAPRYAADDEIVTADEIIEMANAYKLIPKKQRDLILKSTKAAAAEVIRKRGLSAKN